MTTGRRISQPTPDAVREGDSLLQTLAAYAPVVVWVMDASGQVTYISRYWQEFTGRDAEQDVGFKWAEAIHPADRDRAARELMHAHGAGEPSRGEYRVRRADGRYAWLRDFSVPVFDASGRVTGRVGACVDVTEHKHREETEQSIREHLILGQEAERRRVARDLHDVVSQRIALLELTLHEVGQYVPTVSPPLAEKLQAVRDHLDALVSDVHRISHNLHPSTVVNLGLVPSLRRLCAEFSQRTTIAVEFDGTDAPDDASEDMALAIFRVTQECLSNISKHSGSRQARVCLTERSGEICLTIGDRGVGFDLARLKPTAGLGLVSIRERARMLGGTVDITSVPSEGTQVELRVPRV
jgi:PAS domain S-box-containing protein